MKPGLQQRVLVRSAVLALAFLVTVGAFRSLDTSAKVSGGERFVPSVEQMRFATFGFDAAISDYYWLTALQLIGDDSKPFDPAAIAKLIDVVTTLDPWVGHPYRFAAVWLTDSRESVEAANLLLERAVSYDPTDWRNRHYLGFNHFFYLGENAKAADILEGALGLPRVPRYLAPLVAKLKLERDGLETSRTFLASLVDNSEDPFARAEYLKALDEIDTERRARLLDQARSIYVEQRGQDVVRIEDLAAGERPVLRVLPPAHPHFDGFVWEIHSDTGEIVSSFYGERYRPHEHWFDQRRRQRWEDAASNTAKES